MKNIINAIKKSLNRLNRTNTAEERMGNISCIWGNYTECSKDKEGKIGMRGHGTWRK